jgi:hypothetical protein
MSTGILKSMKAFLTPATGKIVYYPDHFADLKADLIEVTGGSWGQGDLDVTDPTAPDAQQLLATQDTFGAVSGAMLVDPDTELAYTTGPEGTANASWSISVRGGIILVDPDTKEPYRY